MGKGPVIAQGSKTLGDKQTAFDAELTAVEAALWWYEDNHTTRWKRRLLRFLELSSVGPYVEGGVDEDQAHAERMEEWIVWEAEAEGARRSPAL
jgi:hypothetical protein